MRHVAVPYLIQAGRPLHRDLVPLRRGDQAERRPLGRRAVPLPVEVHLPAELAVAPRILAGHVVGVVVGAGLDVAGVELAGLDGGDEAGVVAGGEEEGLAAGGGEGVAEAGEDEEEEEEDEAEEDGDHEVQELPLAGAPLRRGQAQVAHPRTLSPIRTVPLSLSWLDQTAMDRGSIGRLWTDSDLIERASEVAVIWGNRQVLAPNRTRRRRKERKRREEKRREDEKKSERSLQLWTGQIGRAHV